MKNLNIKTPLLLIFIALVSNFNCHAQSLEWAAGIIGPDTNEGYAVTVDGNGNTYVAGRFRDSLDMDPGPGTSYLVPNAGFDVYVAKYDTNRNLIWALNIGGSGSENAYSIVSDGLGNIFITGNFMTTVDFDPGPGTANYSVIGGTDSYVLALTTNGGFLWAKTFGGSNADVGRAITMDYLGNLYCTGSFREIVDFDPGAATANLTAVGSFDVYVLKLDIAGNYVWAKSFGGSSDENGLSIETDAAGNVFTAGYFADTCDFDPNTGVYNLVSNGGDDLFISKMDALGNFQWAKSIGGIFGDIASDIAINSLDEILITGRVAGILDMDPGTGTHIDSLVGTNSFVLKLSNSGNYIWSNIVGASSLDQGNSIAINANDNILICGEFNGNLVKNTAAGNVNLNSFGNSDIYVSMLDTGGNFNWIAQMGGSSYDYGTNIAVHSNYAYIIGSFNGTVDFDPDTSVVNITDNGGLGVYLTKLNLAFDTIVGGDTTTALLSLPDKKVDISVFPNPSPGNYQLHFSQNIPMLYLSVRNVLGAVLFTEKLFDVNNHSIYIDEPAGIYFLEIRDKNNRMAVFRLLKE